MVYSITLFLYYTLLLVGATLTPPKSGKEVKVKTDKIKVGPVNQSVFDRQLVMENPSAKDIINNNKAYFKNTNHTSVKGLVLGYVTPWNNHGYDVAKIFANKFTHISPVWLQIKRNGKFKYQVLGLHDVDKSWMASVRKAGSNVNLKIVPRILFDGWSKQDYYKLLKDVEEITAFSNSLIETCKSHKFDGLVFEVWSQVGSQFDSNLLINCFQIVFSLLSKENLDSILVVPPKRAENDNQFTSHHFEQLYDYVKGFSLMTYDFSSIQRPGPNSPINWIESCIKHLSTDAKKRSKILTGFNFYGNSYTANGGGPIVSHEYLNYLKHLKGKLLYDPASAENYFEVKTPDGRYFVFYPTLFSISKRLELVQQLGVGVSIWELGQGLDYFYDLL